MPAPERSTTAQWEDKTSPHPLTRPRNLSSRRVIHKFRLTNYWTRHTPWADNKIGFELICSNCVRNFKIVFIFICERVSKVLWSFQRFVLIPLPCSSLPVVPILDDGGSMRRWPHSPWLAPMAGLDLVKLEGGLQAKNQPLLSKYRRSFFVCNGGRLEQQNGL